MISRTCALAINMMDGCGDLSWKKVEIENDSCRRSHTTYEHPSIFRYSDGKYRGCPLMNWCEEIAARRALRLTDA